MDMKNNEWMKKNFLKAKECLLKTQSAIEEDGLSDQDKLDFFEIYKSKIIDMLDNELDEIKKQLSELETETEVKKQ